MAFRKRLKKRFGKFHTATRAVLFGLGASLLSLLLYWLSPAPLEQLDQRGQDFVFKLRDSQPPPPEVAVVTVDEKSIKRYGRWPWTRVLHAQLIRKLKALGVGVIALDIIYLQPESPEADRALAEALEAPGAPVIGGYFFRNEKTQGDDTEALKLLYDQRIKLILKPPDVTLNVLTFDFIETNQNYLAQHFNGQGFFNAVYDTDGLIRSVPLVVDYEDTLYPSLMLKGLSIYTGLQIGLRASLDGLNSVRLGPVDIPVDIVGKLALNFYNGERRIPLLSASDVLDDNIDPAVVRDALVFIGVTELGIADLRPTPVDSSFPGVMLHATAAANIIQGFYLHRDNRVILINVALMATVPLILVLVLTWVRQAWTMALVFLAIVTIGCFIFYWLVAEQNYLVSFVYPTLAVAMGFIVFVTYYVLTSQRKNRFLTQAFSSYVSPALVNQLLQDPDRLSLAGEKREVTVLFSDVRDFTTISESMAPEQLAEMLNVYLDAMCEIVMNEQGMLDKYIGDAVMALYNAPLDITEHPARAAVSALQMRQRLDELNEQFIRDYGIKLAMGIGLNTGPAIVGNLGGARRFDYTAIGDTINLGARLESATKQYRVHILISETTRKGLDGRFLCRKIDRIRVKGKHTAVEIFEVMGYSGDASKIDLIARFETALEKYFAGDFDGAHGDCLQILEHYPDDGPSEILRHRCELYVAAPPSADWGGVYVATQK